MGVDRHASPDRVLRPAPHENDRAWTVLSLHCGPRGASVSRRAWRGGCAGIGLGTIFHDGSEDIELGITRNAMCDGNNMSCPGRGFVSVNRMGWRGVGWV